LEVISSQALIPPHRTWQLKSCQALIHTSSLPGNSICLHQGTRPPFLKRFTKYFNVKSAAKWDLQHNESVTLYHRQWSIIVEW